MGKEKQPLGPFLRAARERRSLTLRAVERASGVSNAYLSQLESGKIRQPSPRVLHKLSELYEVPYALMLEQAGYPAPAPEAAAGAPMIVDSRLGPMNGDEELALKEYLEFLRSRRTHGEGG
jgi:transcriptional regulator with XRE-family HTH domain